MRRVSEETDRRGKAYTPEEDEFVQNVMLTNREVALMIGRTEKGVKDRRLALKKRCTHKNVDTCSDFEEYSARSGVDDSSCSESAQEDQLSSSFAVPSKPKLSHLLWFEDGRFSYRQTK